MSRYLDWSYWFTRLTLPFTDKVATVMQIVLIVVIIIGIIIKVVAWKVVAGPWHKFWNKIGNWLLILGILFGFNFLLTQSHTPVLGSRFWFGLWGVVGFIWFVFLARYVIWQLPRDVRKKQSQALKDKYLPK